MSTCNFARYCQVAILHFSELLCGSLLFYIFPVLGILSLLDIWSGAKYEMLSITVSVGIFLTTSDFENFSSAYCSFQIFPFVIFFSFLFYNMLFFSH